MNILNKSDCILCQIVRQELISMVVAENKDILAIMDLYPATPGHILVFPKKHVENIFVLPSEIGVAIMTMAITIAKSINQQFEPEGLNLIQANGPVAGQTINHFHLHLLPRYENDGVVLKFGHGSTPAEIDQLAQIATRIRQGLP
jgi:histidine triad (HIT) family protein